MTVHHNEPGRPYTSENQTVSRTISFTLPAGVRRSPGGTETPAGTPKISPPQSTTHPNGSHHAEGAWLADSSPAFVYIPIDIIEQEAMPGTGDGGLDSLLQIRDLGDLYVRFLQGVEGEFSKGDVGTLLASLSIARNGMKIEELVPLSRKVGRRVPALLARLKNHVILQDGIYRIMQPEFRDAILRRYAPAPEQKRELHLRVAFSFSSGAPDRRRRSEGAWHLAQAGAWDQLKQMLTSVPMLLASEERSLRDELVTYWDLVGDRFDPGSEYERNIWDHVAHGGDRSTLGKAFDCLVDLLHALGHHAEAERCRQRLPRHQGDDRRGHQPAGILATSFSGVTTAGSTSDRPWSAVAMPADIVYGGSPIHTYGDNTTVFAISPGNSADDVARGGTK